VNPDLKNLVDNVMLSIRTILHPTDLSDHSEYAFRVASTLARDDGARLIVLHALHVARPPEAGGHGGRGDPPWPPVYHGSLRASLSRLRSSNPRIRIEHRLGEEGTAEEILRVGADVGCDMIVMGVHGWTGLDRMPLGSVAEEVLRRADCPVLAVRIPPAGRSREPVWAEFGFRGVS
jgi:nucleotide-binding universal stress UspA family protein